MSNQNKLPLLKVAMRNLVENLGKNDRVGIVVYSSNARAVLPSTPATQKQQILPPSLRSAPEVSTNGEGGIRQACTMACKHFIQDGTNRVLMATDGDFNVGISDEAELVRLVQQEAWRQVSS